MLVSKFPNFTTLRGLAAYAHTKIENIMNYLLNKVLSIGRNFDVNTLDYG